MAMEPEEFISDKWRDVVSSLIDGRRVVFERRKAIPTAYTQYDSKQRAFIITFPVSYDADTALAVLIHEMGHITMDTFSTTAYYVSIGFPAELINMADDLRINYFASLKYAGFIEFLVKYLRSTRKKTASKDTPLTARWASVFDKSCNRGEGATPQEAALFEEILALGEVPAAEKAAEYLNYLYSLIAYIYTYSDEEATRLNALGPYMIAVMKTTVSPMIKLAIMRIFAGGDIDFNMAEIKREQEKITLRKRLHGEA